MTVNSWSPICRNFLMPPRILHLRSSALLRPVPSNSPESRTDTHPSFIFGKILPITQSGTLMAHQHSARFLKIVDDAKGRIREVSIDDIKTRIDRAEKFVLVDVREESEYANDHLPGAIHLGKGIIERDIEEQAPALDTPL